MFFVLSTEIAIYLCASYRSKLYVDGPLLVNDEGLHGMVEKCGQKFLTSGSHTVYIEGFQGGGGVGMEAKYSGPDTGGKMTFMRSGMVASQGSPQSQYYPQCDPSSPDGDGSQFTVCVFRSEVSIGQIPAFGQADTGLNRLYYVGKGRLSTVNVHDLGQFRSIIRNTPDVNFAWAIYGTLKIGTAGTYMLCITSDDG